MLYAALKTVHVLSILVWIGGMVSILAFVRPALVGLEAPLRLRLMHGVLARFLRAVTWASLLALFTGAWMMGRVAKTTVQGGADFAMPFDWTLMSVLGTLMVLIFGHIRFALFARFNRAVAASDWNAAAPALQQLRQWVVVNLALGLTIVVLTLML